MPDDFADKLLNLMGRMVCSMILDEDYDRASNFVWIEYVKGQTDKGYIWKNVEKF